MRLVEHTLDGNTKTHLPGAALCDFQTACGSCWDEGTFAEVDADNIECAACRQVAQVIFVTLGRRVPHQVLDK